jgi:hypothetical protein
VKVCGFVGDLFQGESAERTIFSLSRTRLAQSLRWRLQV